MARTRVPPTTPAMRGPTRPILHTDVGGSNPTHRGHRITGADFQPTAPSPKQSAVRPDQPAPQAPQNQVRAGFWPLRASAGASLPSWLSCPIPYGASRTDSWVFAFCGRQLVIWPPWTRAAIFRPSNYPDPSMSRRVCRAGDFHRCGSGSESVFQFEPDCDLNQLQLMARSNRSSGT